MVEDANEAPPSRRRAPALGGLIAATLVAAALGGAHGWATTMWRPRAPAAKAAAAPDKASEPAALLLRELPPVVTNLAHPGEAWIRLEGSILVEPAAIKQADALAGQVSADVLAYLRTLSMSQLQGANGLAFLREDLNERVRQRSQGKAREIVIQTLVIQ